MRSALASLGLLLVVACGDNPPNAADEVGESGGSQGTNGESTSSAGESGSADSLDLVEDAEASSDSSTSEASTSDSSSSDSSTSEASSTDASSTDTTETVGHVDDHTEDGHVGTETTDGGLEFGGVCVNACEMPAHCAIPMPAFDVDNWECLSNGCHWLGCHDGECSNGQVCQDPGNGTPTCLPSCAAPADCDQGFGPYLAANYTCDAGACVFLGCASDVECTDLDPGFVCNAASLPLPSCTPACASPQDCASPMPAYNLDNWACVAGACTWLGCKPGECGKTKDCLVLP